MIREKLIFKLPQPQGDAFACTDTDAVAFINAMITATGSPVDTIQQNAICGLVSRLKGNFTTNGTDIWTDLTTSGAVLYPLLPNSDTNALASAYELDLVSATSKGTYFNFLAADITPSGVTASSGKYFDLGVAPSDYSTNDNAFGYYNNSAFGSNGVDVGTRETTGTVNSSFVNGRNASGQMFYANNDASGSSTRTGSLGGFFLSGRSDASTRYGVINASITTTSISSTFAPTYNYFAHGFNNNGVYGAPAGYKKFCLYIAGLEGYNNANKIQDLYDAIQWYQQNVITGGRHV